MMEQTTPPDSGHESPGRISSDEARHTDPFGTCRALGYSYMVTEATNQWTGAAFEALGGVRVHFAPFQARRAVPKCDEPLEDVTTSPNGFLSEKDSGGMFYVTCLA